MAIKLFEVTYYSVSLKRKGLYGELASIRCMGQGAELNIFFMPEDTTLPYNMSHIQDSGISSGHLYQLSNRYPWFLDLLRNEAPIWAMIDSSDTDRNSIFTQECEPVGDGEL